MFKRVKSDSVDYKKLNILINLSNKFMRVLYSISILAIIILVVSIFKQLKILSILGEILGLLSSFFIGLIVAWLLDPFVTFLQKKGVKRGIGVGFSYLILFTFLFLLGMLIIPAFASQINEMITKAPDTISSLKLWFNNIVDKFSNNYNLDNHMIKSNAYEVIYTLFHSFTSDGPSMILSIGKSIFSGGLNIVIGLLIGIYLLIDFDSAKHHLVLGVPKKYKKDMAKLSDSLNSTLRSYVYGTLIVMAILFVFQSIGMAIAGMEAPMVFGLFCAITNVIPYLGPYIGGIPSIIIAFTINPSVGVGVLISVLICQGLESYLLTPTIMSKTMKLHPVTIIIGLLLFGHFFGILGMLFATPIISCIKIIAKFFIEKYQLFETEEESDATVQL